MTLLAEAFAKAGIDTDASRLAVMANDTLARFGISPRKARDEFSEILRKDEGLRSAIAELYLTQRAADMRGESLIGGGYQASARKCQDGPAPADQSVGGDGGQASRASAINAVPPSPPPKADRGDQVHPACEAKPPLSPRSVPKSSLDEILADSDHGGRGQTIRAASSGQPVAAPPVVTRPVARDPVPWRPPVVNKPRGLAAAALIAPTMLRSVFDTFKIRGNLPIGDLSWAEAKSIARLNECEARVLRYITDHVANARPGALIRDVVKVEVVENAIRLAAEAGNADA